MEVILTTILLLTLAFLALGFNFFFRKNGRFPETEIGRNKKMKNLGISCPKCDENFTWHKMQQQRKPKIKFSEMKIDTKAMN